MKTAISVFLLCVLFISVAFPQVLVEEPTSKYQSDEWGFNAAIANQGMGFGGFYLKNFSDYSYIGVNLAFYKNRDKYEYDDLYYSSIYGGVYTINRYNNLYLVPFSMEFKRHFWGDLFANDIRPYIFAQVGGIFGMNFPENSKSYGYQTKPTTKDLGNEYQFGFQVGYGLSFDIATKRKVFFSIKPVFNWIYFPTPIAQENWHSTLEFQFVIGMRR